LTGRIGPSGPIQAGRITCCPWPCGRGSAPGDRGSDLGKRIKGRKRHIVTDTTGLLVGLEVHSAGIQDRDGAPNMLEAVAARYHMLRHIFARWGLCWPQNAGRAASHRSLDSPDRQTFRHRRRLLNTAPPMGGRAHPRLARAMPVKGLRKIHRQRRGLGPHCPHLTRHTTSCKD